MDSRQAIDTDMAAGSKGRVTVRIGTE